MDFKKAIEILKRPTPENRIKHRTQSGKKLSYVDARYVMDVLDEAVGSGCWKNDFKILNNNMFCGISILIDGEWVAKWDVGVESNFEKEKGQVSDSFKRAAVHWGIARDLYDEDSGGVEKSAYTNNSSANSGSYSDSDPSIVSFGKKWKGKLWSEVDDDYIMWGCEKCSVPWQKELFEVERQRRAMKQDDINQSTPNGETDNPYQVKTSDIPF